MNFCRAQLLLALSLSVAAPVWSQQRLEENNFNIDVVDGAVLGSNRIVSMGGAFTALATSIDGAAWNPASYGSRTLWERDWFEWDVAAGLMVSGIFSRNDWFNNGRGEGIGADDFFFYDTGLRLQFAKLGVGGLLRAQTFTVETGDDTVHVNNWNIKLGGAWMFFDGELVVGLGARRYIMSMTLPGDDSQSLVRFKGTGLEAGAVWRPAGWPIRVGASGRAPVKSRQVAKKGEEVADQVLGFVLPNRVHMPWEAQLGFALQLGERPMNQRWNPPPDPADRLLPEMKARWCEREAAQAKKEAREEGLDESVVGQCPRLRRRPQSRTWWKKEERLRQREQDRFEERVEKKRDEIKEERRRRYEEMPRHYWLVSVDLMLIGPTRNGIGVDAFLDQELRPSGEDVSFSVRLGTEVEPWANRLKLRVGSYVEPGRITGVNPRIHGTAGFDVRLFTWDLFGLLNPVSFRAGAMVDLAPRYLNWGVGIGIWH